MSDADKILADIMRLEQVDDFLSEIANLPLPDETQEIARHLREASALLGSLDDACPRGLLQGLLARCSELLQSTSERPDEIETQIRALCETMTGRIRRSFVPDLRQDLDRLRQAPSSLPEPAARTVAPLAEPEY